MLLVAGTTQKPRLAIRDKRRNPTVGGVEVFRCREGCSDGPQQVVELPGMDLTRTSGGCTSANLVGVGGENGGKGNSLELKRALSPWWAG